MDGAYITQLISNLGFPIAVCIAMFWYINKKDGQHREEVDTLRIALENNTTIITKLYEKLGGKNE